METKGMLKNKKFTQNVTLQYGNKKYAKKDSEIHAKYYPIAWQQKVC